MIHIPHTKTTLKNGLRVITVPSKNTSAVATVLLVGTGSHHETKELSGISHYLEHLFFKGSKKYNTPHKLSHTLDSIGASYNASTSDEWTSFYVKTVKKHLEVALDVMSDFLERPLFTADEIEREKEVILQELNMYYDTPQRRVIDVLREALYGDQPAGRDIGGTPASVKKITRKEVVEYFNQQYKAENMVLVFGGNISPKDSERLARKYFDEILSGDREITKRPVTEIATTMPTIQVEEKKTDQTHLCMGFYTCDMLDDRRYPLAVLSNALGGGMSSRLFTEVREKKGLCYAVFTSDDMGTDYGNFFMYSGITLGKLEEAIETVVKEMKSIKTKGIKKSELEKAVNSIEASLLFRIEESQSLAYAYGLSEILTGEIETPEHFLNNLKKVTLKDVQQVANDFLVREKARVAMVASHDTKKSLVPLFDEL